MESINRVLVGLVALLFSGSLAFAQTDPAPNYLNPLNRLTPSAGVVLIDPTTKNPYAVTSDASEATLSGVEDNTADILTELQTPATALPPLSTTSDITLGVAADTSASAESCRVLKASAGNVYSVSGYASAAGFAMLFNATSAPADGAVTPAIPAIYVSSAGSWSADFGAIPLAMSSGIVVCFSSTGPFTKTAFSTSNVLSGRVK